jgi:hypothetical protein
LATEPHKLAEVASRTQDFMEHEASKPAANVLVAPHAHLWLAARRSAQHTG